jgi:hypothetical protein
MVEVLPWNSYRAWADGSSERLLGDLRIELKNNIESNFNTVGVIIRNIYMIREAQEWKS